MRYDIAVSAPICPAATQQIPADSLGDRAIPVLIGALVALLGTAVIQLFIVPVVEARKRREQRWEEDVHAMGELLTFDLPRAITTMARHLTMVVFLQDPPEGADPERLATARDRRRDELDLAAAEITNLRRRIDWLEERIRSLAPDNKRTTDFARKCMRLYVHEISFTSLEWRARHDNSEPLSEAEINKDRRALDESVKQVLEATKAFGTGAPPRNSPLRPHLRSAGHARRWLRGVASRFKKHDAS